LTNIFVAKPARLQLWGCSDKRFMKAVQNSTTLVNKKGGLIYQSGE
jgi:hypothetical protein